MKIVISSVKAEAKRTSDDLVNRLNKLGYTYNLVNSSIQGLHMKRPVLDFKNINEFYKLSKKTDDSLIVMFDDGGNPCAVIVNDFVSFEEA